MTNPFVDILGAPIEVGDTLAVAFPGYSNSSPTFRIGTVLSFGNQKGFTRRDPKTGLIETVPGDPTMEMDWSTSPIKGQRGPEKSKLVDQSSRRYMKIN